MNAAAVNFAATHGSFIALAVGSVVPALREDVPRAIVAATVLTIALILRVVLSRRYLAVRPRATYGQSDGKQDAQVTAAS